MASPPKPPRSLGEAGLALWKRIIRQYDLTSGAGLDLLLLACEALDRAEACRARLEGEGLTVADARGVVRPHPLLKAETDCRAFCARTLLRLAREL